MTLPPPALPCLPPSPPDWTIFSAIVVFESTLTIFTYIWGYYIVKTAVLLWLIAPQTQVGGCEGCGGCSSGAAIAPQTQVGLRGCGGGSRGVVIAGTGEHAVAVCMKEGGGGMLCVWGGGSYDVFNQPLIALLPAGCQKGV